MINYMKQVPFEDLGIVRCQNGFGLDCHNVSCAKKDKAIQIDQTNAPKMDMGMKDKRGHCDMIQSTHMMLHCLFKYVYQDAIDIWPFMGEIKACMSNGKNHMSGHNNKCTWKLGKSFDSKMNPNSISSQNHHNKASKIELGEEYINHLTKLIKFVLSLVRQWYKYVDE